MEHWGPPSPSLARVCVCRRALSLSSSLEGRGGDGAQVGGVQSQRARAPPLPRPKEVMRVAWAPPPSLPACLFLPSYPAPHPLGEWEEKGDYALSLCMTLSLPAAQIRGKEREQGEEGEGCACVQSSPFPGSARHIISRVYPLSFVSLTRRPDGSMTSWVRARPHGRRE